MTHDTDTPDPADLLAAFASVQSYVRAGGAAWASLSWAHHGHVMTLSVTREDPDGFTIAGQPAPTQATT